MPRLVLATRNKHKTKELTALLQGLGVDVVGLDEISPFPETVEDRPTIAGNAEKKAREAAAAANGWALADDTGLEVSALGGAPGVYSARYAGPGCTYEDNNRKLLAALEGQKDRSAVFRTVMALAHPDGRLELAEGRLPGTIASSPRGTNGFGYDPVFVLEDGRALAELSDSEKNQVSHRARALHAVLPHLRRLVLGALACAAFALGARPAIAGRTEPGQETIWDQIMAAQANRDLRIGARALEERRYELALKEFTRAAAANPSDPAARMMLGVAQYWTGDVDASVASYKRAIELDPNNAQSHMLLGISLAWQGNVKGSYAEFKRAAELDPSRPDIQMNMGSIEDSLGLTQEAMFHFRKAASLAPSEPLYRFQLGMLYRKLGRDADAAEELHQALKLYGGFEDALLELGAVEERRGDYKAAIHSFKKAVDLKSRDAVARYRLARLYLMTEDAKRARGVMADAFHLTPEEGGEGLRLSVSYAGGKKNGPAEMKDQKGKTKAGAPAEPPKTPPSSDPLDVFGRSLERIPLDQNAIMQVDVVFVPRPKLVKASPESQSSLKRALERERGAQQAAPKAVRRDYPIRSGTADSRGKEIEKVLEDLRQTLATAPPDSDVRLGMNLTYQKLSDARTATGGGGPGGDSKDQPKVSFQPRQVGNDLGLWIIGTGWMALVEEVLPEAGSAPQGKHAETADWWVATGLGYATLGEGQKALEAFERAVSMDPKSELGLVGRGVAAVMTGDEKSAEASFQEALKINPKNHPASDGLKWLQRPSVTRKAAVGAQ